jgi:hypothetical protein
MLENCENSRRNQKTKKRSHARDQPVCHHPENEFSEERFAGPPDNAGPYRVGTGLSPR